MAAMLYTQTFHRTTALNQDCFLELSRVVAPQSFYALTCKCAPRIAKSFTYVDAPPKKMDTVGRGQATLRCIKQRREEITLLCQNLPPKAFERRLTPVLSFCVNEEVMTKREAKQTAPYKFARDRCESRFVWLDEIDRVIRLAWICECKQTDLLEVIPGWARYNITGSATELRKELTLIRKCTEDEAEIRLNNVCQNSPGNFYILALQIFQTCCKRTRVNTDKKFECEHIVPKDLSNLKKEI